MKGGKMRVIKIEKAVVNIGVGDAGEKLLKAKRVLELVTGGRAVETVSKTTNKDLGIRKKQPIGCKVTLRGARAEEFLKRALWVKNNRVASYSFDAEGNFSFGISDYTDFEGMKYDPEIGIFGMDISVTLTRPGKRVTKRRRAPSAIPKRHRMSRMEGMEYVKNKFGVEVVE